MRKCTKFVSGIPFMINPFTGYMTLKTLPNFSFLKMWVTSYLTGCFKDLMSVKHLPFTWTRAGTR